MPLITMPNPLTAASEAVGGYTTQKNENIDRAEQRRQRDATLALERERLASQEKYQASSLDLASKAQDDAHLRTLTDVESSKLHNKIAEATADFEKQMRPVTMQLAQAQLKAQTDANAQGPLKVALLKFQVEGARVDAAMKAKWGPKEAELAIQTGQMNLKLIAQEIASSKASEYRTMHPVGAGASGVAGQKLSDSRTEAAAEFDVNKQIADDQLAAGKTPAEVRGFIEASTSMSNVTKLKLIRYLQTVKAKPAPQPSGPDLGGMLRGVGQMINPYIGK